MFKSSERQIFRFQEGDKARAVDPLAVYRKLQSHPGFNLVADVQAVELLNSQLARVVADPKAAESTLGQEVQARGLAAWDRILTATRQAFGVSEFHLDDDGHESGLTDSEVMLLFWQFIDYLGAVKKNSKPSLTVPRTTVPVS